MKPIRSSPWLRHGGRAPPWFRSWSNSPRVCGLGSPRSNKARENITLHDRFLLLRLRQWKQQTRRQNTLAQQSAWQDSGSQIVFGPVNYRPGILWPWPPDGRNSVRSLVWGWLYCPDRFTRAPYCVLHDARPRSIKIRNYATLLTKLCAEGAPAWCKMVAEISNKEGQMIGLVAMPGLEISRRVPTIC